MNRPVNPPPFAEAYRQIILELARAIALHLREKPEARPVFWLPPVEVLVVAVFEDVTARIAGNDDARAITAMASARFGGNPKGITLKMFDIALQALEHPAITIERVSLAKLHFIPPDGSHG